METWYFEEKYKKKWVELINRLVPLLIRYEKLMGKKISQYTDMSRFDPIDPNRQHFMSHYGSGEIRELKNKVRKLENKLRSQE
jgi:hypothetical protein